MSMQDSWVPANGDRIKHTATVFGDPVDRSIWPDMTEILVLRKEAGVFGFWHATTTSGDSRVLTTEQMLRGTCEWLPWPHQIIDYLVRFRSMDLSLVLSQLAKLAQYKREATFEELCDTLLKTVEAAQADEALKFSTSVAPGS